jgi:hypothetical protein
MRFTGTNLLMLLLVTTGCAVHSPMLMTSKVEATKIAKTLPPHANKVFISAKDLPAGIAYDTIAQIEVGRVWYGDDDMVKIPMADKARELGADAVIKTVIWRQPAGWAWSAPQGSGTAVKLQDKSQVDFTKIPGGWY